MRTTMMGLTVLALALLAPGAGFAQDAEGEGRAAMAARLEARGAFEARWVKELFRAGIGPDERDRDEILHLLWACRSAPLLLEHVRTRVADAAQSSDDPAREILSLLRREKKNREYLAIMLDMADGKSENGAGRAETWAEVVEWERRGDAVFAEADRLLGHISTSALVENEALPLVRRAAQTPGLLEALGDAYAQAPERERDLREMAERALADPQGFMERQRLLGEARRFVAGLGRPAFARLDDEETFLIWSLRDDPGGLEAAEEILSANYGNERKEALEHLRRGENDFRAWQAARNMRRAFTEGSAELPFENVWQAVSEVLPEAAETLRAAGVRPLRLMPGAEEVRDLPTGTLPNGLSVTPVAFSLAGTLPRPFSFPAVEPLAERPGGVALRESERVYACVVGGLLNSVEDVIGPSAREKAVWPCWEDGGLFSPLSRLGAQLVGWRPAFARLWAFLPPVDGGMQIWSPPMIVISARPPEEVAAHLGGLSVMQAGQARLPGDIFAELDRGTARPDPKARERAARPDLRFVSISNSMLFLTLAQLARPEELDRLFGPISAVLVLWPEDREHPWRELRRTNPQDGAVVELGKSPVLILPKEAERLLEARRLMFVKAAARFRLNMCVADRRQDGACPAALRDDAEARRLIESLLDEGLSLCRDAGLDPGPGLEQLTRLLFLWSERDPQAVSKARAIMSDRAVPLEKRQEALLGAIWSR